MGSSKQDVHFVLDADITLKPNGVYDLMCVLTHSGNAAVGHYVAWVKQDDGMSIWSFSSK